MAVGEWDQRQLCPDGACVGLIGPDGTCKVCGHVAPNWGDERNRGLIAEGDEQDADDSDDDLDADGDAEDDLDEDSGDEDGEDEDGGDEDGDDEDDDEDSGDDSARKLGDEDDGTASTTWSARALCPDGGCIGVIGDDGACKVCGRRANGKAAGAAAARGEDRSDRGGEASGAAARAAGDGNASDASDGDASDGDAPAPATDKAPA